MKYDATNAAVAVEVNLPELETGLWKLLGTQLTLEDERTLKALLRHWQEQSSLEPMKVWCEMAAHLGSGSGAESSEEWTAATLALLDKMGDTHGGDMFMIWAGGVWVRAMQVPKPMFSKEEREMNEQVETLKVEISSLEPELAQLKQEKKALTERKSALDSSINKSKALLAETKKSILEVEGR